jgi:hypothetical protein
MIAVTAYMCEYCFLVHPDKQKVSLHEKSCIQRNKGELPQWKPSVTIDRRTIARQEESEG